MTEPATALAPTAEALPPVTMMRPEPASAFSSMTAFENAQRMAQALASSDLVPQDYRGRDKLGNVLIALEMAQRCGANVLAVMQSLYVVHGRPSWSAQFLIAAANTSGKFATPIRFDMLGDADTDDRTCVAWAIDLTGERLDGPAVSVAMAKAEGWVGRKGSKWVTMPELMLRYRAATLFVRLYAPEIAMGMQTAEEIEDLGEARVVESAPVVSLEDLNVEIAAERSADPYASPEVLAERAEIKSRQSQDPPADCAHEAVATGEDGREVCTVCGEVLEPPANIPARPTADEVVGKFKAATNQDEYNVAADLMREMKRGSKDRNQAQDAAADARRRLNLED